MLQASDGFRFPAETGHLVGAGVGAGQHHLQGHQPAQLDVAGQVHHPHAATAQLTQDFVTGHGQVVGPRAVVSAWRQRWPLGTAGGRGGHAQGAIGVWQRSCTRLRQGLHLVGGHNDSGAALRTGGGAWAGRLESMALGAGEESNHETIPFS